MEDAVSALTGNDVGVDEGSGAYMTGSLAMIVVPGGGLKGLVGLGIKGGTAELAGLSGTAGRLIGKAAASPAPHVVGFSADTVASAFQGMRGDGGHAMRYLLQDGFMLDKGSTKAKAAVFQELLTPVLTNPMKTFDWRIGAEPAKAFAGVVQNVTVVAFVAKGGEYQGRVLSAFAPTPANLAKWGLP
jgi:hypothetical protein